ncbi:EboA domain-containing protein [Anthocerotibacter panamensis]|uniref:EboA domain-containing protein n=1 Tax=Anthocerotibacter panamensis TaxID=2857077 RepID=UPI001C40646D|nr:EboA domain-containing protein [Anthocerotibacter panamensis]
MHRPSDLSAVELLERWLAARLALPQQDWLTERCRQISTDPQVLFAAFSAVPRFTGKQDLSLAPAELQDAGRVCPGWNPSTWSLDQCARALLLLSLPAEPIAPYLHILEELFSCADVGELVALYQTLPLLPHAQQHRGRAAAGVRSNITAVFNAVALYNPYPAHYFADPAWNQMILKAVFLGSPLPCIPRLDERANPGLAEMLTDYAQERWAASRPVPLDLWRLVGPFLDPRLIPRLAALLASPDPEAQEVAALTLNASAHPEAQALLQCYPQVHTRIQQGHLSWRACQRE